MISYSILDRLLMRSHGCAVLSEVLEHEAENWCRTIQIIGFGIGICYKTHSDADYLEIVRVV